MYFLIQTVKIQLLCSMFQVQSSDITTHLIMKVLIVLCLAAMALADEKKSHDGYDKHDGYVSYSSGSKFWKKNSEI